MDDDAGEGERQVVADVCPPPAGTADESVGPPLGVFELPAVVLDVLFAQLSLADAMGVRQTSRQGREAVLLHHASAGLVFGLLIPRLLSDAGLPSSPTFTSLAHVPWEDWFDKWEIGLAAESLKRKLPLEGIVKEQEDEQEENNDKDEEDDSDDDDEEEPSDEEKEEEDTLSGEETNTEGLEGVGAPGCEKEEEEEYGYEDEDDDDDDDYELEDKLFSGDYNPDGDPDATLAMLKEEWNNLQKPSMSEADYQHACYAVPEEFVHSPITEQELSDVVSFEEQFEVREMQPPEYWDMPEAEPKRQALVDMLDEVFTLTAVQLRQNEIARAAFWRHHDEIDAPHFASIVQKHISIKGWTHTTNGRVTGIACMLEVQMETSKPGGYNKYHFNISFASLYDWRKAALKMIKVIWVKEKAEECKDMIVFYDLPDDVWEYTTLSEAEEQKIGKICVKTKLVNTLAKGLGLSDHETVLLILNCAGCEVTMDLITKMTSMSELQKSMIPTNTGVHTAKRFSQDKSTFGLDGYPPLRYTCRAPFPSSKSQPELELYLVRLLNDCNDQPLHQLIALVQKWRLKLQLTRAYQAINGIDWVVLADLVHVLPFIKPLKGEYALVGVLDDTAAYGHGSMELSVQTKSGESGTLRISCSFAGYDYAEIDMNVVASSHAVAQCFDMDEENAGLNIHIQEGYTWPSNLSHDGFAFLHAFAKYVGVPSSRQWYPWRLKARGRHFLEVGAGAVILVVCCLAPGMYFDLLPIRPFIEMLRPRRYDDARVCCGANGFLHNPVVRAAERLFESLFSEEDEEDLICT